MNERIDSLPRALKSWRRTATVTISTPLASWQRRITSNDGYLPVPTISREVNVCPAMVKGLSVMSTTSDERDDLDAISCAQLQLGLPRAANHLGVHLDRDPRTGDV